MEEDYSLDHQTISLNKLTNNISRTDNKKNKIFFIKIRLTHMIILMINISNII